MAKLAGLGGAHGAITGRAVPAGLYGGAARLMAARSFAPLATGAPGAQQGERSGQVLAEVGQLVRQAELEQGARTVAERAGPAVVAIGRRPRGSGVVINADQVLTNAHNLRDRTTSVTFADGRVVQASVVGVDLDGDLAVLAVETGDAQPLAWGDPDNVTAGALVYAVAEAAAGSARRSGW